jgi:hypothetical protein
MTVIEHLNEPESKHVLGRENSGWVTADVQIREIALFGSRAAFSSLGSTEELYHGHKERV